MIADKLLSRLDSVRETGCGRWVARCPAHHDCNPSLSIREADDKVLIHCFSECQVADIIASVGLELHDLFEPRPNSDRSCPAIRPIPAKDILLALGTDLSFMAICAADLARNQRLDESAMERLTQASARFRSAVHAGGIR